MQDFVYGDDNLTSFTRDAPRFAFLTNRVFLIIDYANSGSLDLFSFRKNSAKFAADQSVDEDSLVSEPTQLLSLHLPTLSPDIYTKNINTQAIHDHLPISAHPIRTPFHPHHFPTDIFTFSSSSTRALEKRNAVLSTTTKMLYSVDMLFTLVRFSHVFFEISVSLQKTRWGMYVSYPGRSGAR